MTNSSLAIQEHEDIKRSLGRIDYDVNKHQCRHIFVSGAFSDELVMLHTVIMGLMFFGIITSNLCMIFGLLKVNRRMTLSKKLFVCLSCSDLITGLCTLPVQTLASFEKDRANCALVAVQAFFNAFPTSLSLFFLLHISFARYCTVKYANSRIFGLQKRFWKHLVIFEIAVSFANGLWYALGASQTRDHVHHSCFILFCSFFVVVILSMILALNRRLWTTLCRHRHFTITNHINEERAIRSHKTAVKTIIILSIILLICYMPTVLSFLLTAIFLFLKDERAKYYHYLIPWSYIPLLMNSGINSFVIIVRDKKIRSFLKTIRLKLEIGGEAKVNLSLYNSDSPYPGNHLTFTHLPSFISSSFKLRRKASPSKQHINNCNRYSNIKLSPRLSPDGCSRGGYLSPALSPNWTPLPSSLLVAPRYSHETAM